MASARDPQADPQARGALLQEGWVIANHILVSFHVAFISSVLAIPDSATTKAAVLRFIFFSPETLVSALFTYLVFHAGVALHELGHFREAARLRALNESIQDAVQARLAQPFVRRIAYLGRVFLLAPFGRAQGIKREGLNYYPDAPYNLAVAAAGPRASRNVALLALPAAGLLLAAGLLTDGHAALYPGRLLLGLGLVCLLDFLLADPGKYREFRDRERRAREASSALPEPTAWRETAPAVKRRLVTSRMQAALHPRLGAVTAPWQFRNCGMGGRHTEKEYPESNISMQEAMFLILGAVDSQEAQEMTVRLQGRLKEILEKEEGCRVMGIGLEGGLAPYVDRGEYPLPEVRLWAMMKQAIEECGYRPGEDVAIALDAALSELEIAYREQFDIPDSVGMYLFWRDRSMKVLDRDGVRAIYEQAINAFDIPVLSIEDGFSEDDHEGWRQLLATLGDRILVIGDDLVTTNDRAIEQAASRGLINAVLVKANQIGTLYETLLAILVTLGKGLELVVSHRSKSPNDDMEAHIALACNSLGLKTGGGANTERLVKYQAVHVQMARVAEAPAREPRVPATATVERLRSHEEPTNAGIPTVGTEATLSLAGADAETTIRLSFRGATPLGTSAGTGEAVHLVDRFIEGAEHKETLDAHPGLFRSVEPGVVEFRGDVSPQAVEAAGDEALTALYERASRYAGKGCLNAVDNVREVIAPHFVGRNVAGWSLLDIDRELLWLELETARRRGKLAAEASPEELVRFAQRKQNLGMNGMLSVSLALARAVAHVRGRELFELLREELLNIIERLCETHGVAIAGSRFEDYVAALREANRLLEAQGVPLHEALRRVTGIYAQGNAGAGEARPWGPSEGSAGPPQVSLTPEGGGPEGTETAQPSESGRSAPAATAAAATTVCAPKAGPAQPAFDAHEAGALAALDAALYAGYVQPASDAARREALRTYLYTMSALGRRYRMFEVANHRVFRAGDGLLVPYDAHGSLVLHAVDATGARKLSERRLPHGGIVTDALIEELAGRSGEPVDLEREIYHLDVEGMPAIRIARLRDMALVLERLNASGSRHEAVYLLRLLVARLCSASFQGFPGAKNLQPEVARLRQELATLLNGPFAYRLRLPMRVLVRNISGLVSRPKLIDELWQGTIDLAEVHVRGSAVTNEIRRTAHHALGRRTLRLAQAYQHWLATGDDSRFEQERPAAADAAARENPVARALVDRIVTTLEALLGTSQIATRFAEWRQAYADELVRCESSSSLDEELEALVERGIRTGNRWTYQHHLRSLRRKAAGGAWSQGARAPFEAVLEELEAARPGDAGFDTDSAETRARGAVATFVRALRTEHQDGLFDDLQRVLEPYEGGRYMIAFERNCALRRRLDADIDRGVFPEQSYLLHQLDCLLEEMGYFALRHVASGYEDKGIDLEECLRIVHLCAGNLGNDGLFSRELWDLSAMLVDSGHTARERLDVLEHVQRDYHRVVHRVSVPYEHLSERLGHGSSGMRAVLANFQRAMHDLNSLVHFADLARSHLQGQAHEAASTAAVDAGSRDPWDFLHLSHTADIARRIEDWDAPSLLDRYGGKGSGLAYIAYLGVPTRDGFVIPTTLPRLGLHLSERERLEREVLRHVGVLQEDLAQAAQPARLGDPAAPLLLAVRGGSVFSMPGMLATVVFVGITDAVAGALAREDGWYAWDSYRRFLVSYAAAAWNLDLEALDLVEQQKRKHGARFKSELPAEAMRSVVEASKAAIRAAGHGDELDALLADPARQLLCAVRAVHASWDRERARRYRAIKRLGDGWHTAVIVQQMASGNRSNPEARPGVDERALSLTGVIPSSRVQPSGFRTITGDFKLSACGDDLVGGLTAATSFRPVAELRELAPMLARRLGHVDARLRRFRGTDPEIEFTVERGVLSVLQARAALVEAHVPPTTFEDAGAAAAQGIGIRGGAFRGRVAFDEEDLARLAGEPAVPEETDGVLLLLENPTPDEIPLILSADALLTAKGGSTSHAAVAVQGVEGKAYCAVLGAAPLRVDAGKREAYLSAEGGPSHIVRPGDVLSIHGQTGEVFVGSRAVQAVQAAQDTQGTEVPDSRSAWEAGAPLPSPPG